MDFKKKQLLKKLLLACSSVLVLIVMMELMLSIISFIYYPRLTTTDESLGWLYMPTSEAIQRHDRGGVINTTFINKSGFRDDDFATDEDYLRIMVLGDSMTFGLEADQEEIFPVLVEQMLKEKLGNPKIDVMNFGITGYGTTQQLLCLKKYQPEFKPDVVVLAMDEFNDFEDNTKVFWNRYTPHYEIENGEYVLHDQPSTYYRALNFLRDHSTLFYGVAHLCTYTRPLFTEHTDLTKEQQIELACDILKKMHQFTQEKGIPFYMLYIRDPEAPTREYEAVQKVADEQGIPLTVIPVVKEERVAGIGHWNGKGHARAANVVTEMLLADELVASKTGTSDKE